MGADKEFKVRFTGDGSQLGAESKKVVASLNDVKGALGWIIGGFTGGLFGGSVVGAISTLVSAIGTQISNLRAIAQEARSLGISDTFLRGAKRMGSVLFDQQDLIPSAIGSASQKRADALFNDPGARRAFSDLGLSPEKIAGLSKEDLFAAIVRAFREGPDNRERRVAVGDLFGDDQANKLLPYMIGGRAGQLDFTKEIEEAAKAFYTPDFMRRIVQSDKDPYRASIEPLSRAGIGSAKREDDLRRENDQRALHNARERMTIEEKIASIEEERARLQAKMAAETNGETREKIRTDILQLESEQNRLGRDTSSSRARDLVRSLPAVDDFAQRGLYIGGSSQVPSILQAHSQKLDQVIRVLEAQYRENSKNWGE